MSAKKTKSTKDVVPAEVTIHTVRGLRVMVDSDLAALYEVETGHLNRAVQRNRERFPSDFMFPLTAEEVANLKCQIGTSSFEHGGRRRSRPFAFTQEGIAMLSGVLRSERAVQVNIAIMRAFVRLREMVLSVDSLAARLENLERGFRDQGADIDDIFEALRQLMRTPEPPLREIGFGARD
jgi:ORF6N domain